MTAGKQEPHPQRCETCKHFQTSDKGMSPDCDQISHWLTEGDRKLIAEVGCASHNGRTVPEVSAVDRFNRALISGHTISKEVDVGISFSAQELTKRDAAIRKAERERLLEAIHKSTYQMRHQASSEEVNSDTFVLDYSAVYELIQSLRGGERE